MNKWLSILLLIFGSLFFNPKLQAQKGMETKIQLANQAYELEEYEKAKAYYEDIFSRIKSRNIYERLVDCYVRTDEKQKAEKTIKKMIKRSPEETLYRVDLGHFYDRHLEDRKKAEQAYKAALSILTPQQSQINRLANHFIQYREYKFAEATYLKGRKLLNGAYPFHFELAGVYARQGETESMIQEYLDVLQYNRAYIQSVQNVLQTVLNPDPEGKQMEQLRQTLLRRIQKQPEIEVYSELLIWLFIQDKNFNGAFAQAKALDKRLNENGKRLESLARLSLANENYDVAQKSYQYLIDKGPNTPYFLTAKMQVVEVLEQKITTTLDYTETDILELEKAYQNTLSELGKSSLTVPLMRGFARLKAFYQNDTKGAISLLEETIALNGIDAKNKAEAKLELGDMMLLTGEIWEASLLYSQVDKDFKYDELGERAKFKNAKVAFYTGDFKWSQAQLDVLKGSTSKLISNDAMDLSLLITDNTGLDSIIEPMQMYARADLLLFQNQSEAALKTLDSIPKFYPLTSLKDEILFIRYKIAFKAKKYEEAGGYLETLAQDYGQDILGDDAIYFRAKLLENQLGDLEGAKALYKQLIFDYPGSLYVVESRKRFRELRGDFKEPEQEIEENQQNP